MQLAMWIAHGLCQLAIQLMIYNFARLFIYSFNVFFFAHTRQNVFGSCHKTIFTHGNSTRQCILLFVRCTRGHFGINNHRPSILFGHFFHSHMNCRVNTNKIRNAIYGKAINFAVILTSHNQHCFRSTNIIYCTELD